MTGGDVQPAGKGGAKGAGHGGQARGYSWPPFQPGHRLSMTHGGRSEARIEEVAAEIEPLLWRLSHLVPEDAQVVRRLARVEARLLLFERWLDLNGWFKPDGSPKAVIQRLEAAERTALALWRELGCTPRARQDLNLKSAGADAFRALERHTAATHGDGALDAVDADAGEVGTDA